MKKVNNFYSLTVLAKNTSFWMFDRVLNVPLDYPSCFTMVIREHLIYAKLVIIFIPNLEFSPYSELVQGSKTCSLTKVNKMIIHLN